MQSARHLDDACDVGAIDKQRSPQNAPAIFPTSECAFDNLPQKRAKIRGNKGRDNVALAREGVIADNAPLCAETACKNFPAERRTPESDGERERDVNGDGAKV